MLPLIAATLLLLAGPVIAADKATAKAPAATQKAPATTEKIDLNTASQQELGELAGIGEARAKAIIKGRPYKGKDELVERKIIPQSVYDKIKDKVIAKQGK
jgi:DNA uptake protein ComE-like DNA-binding protein